MDLDKEFGFQPGKNKELAKQWEGFVEVELYMKSSVFSSSVSSLANIQLFNLDIRCSYDKTSGLLNINYGGIKSYK